jgi:hypothetical protein
MRNLPNEQRKILLILKYWISTWITTLRIEYQYKDSIEKFQTYLASIKNHLVKMFIVRFTKYFTEQ